MIKEIKLKARSGYNVVALLLVSQASFFVLATISPSDYLATILALLTILASGGWLGFFLVNPNEAKVLQLFGSYVGTCTQPGLHWANPFYVKRKVSLRVRNFESDKLKVNDAQGNPIEIAAVVVWKVVDSAEAIFEVEDFEEFVKTQSESALRNLATSYSYDYSSEDESDVTLRGNTQEITERLRNEIQERLNKAGLEIIESRITHLAYAPEIANAMLRRQQAIAVIAARNKVVEGAVSMVEMALNKLSDKKKILLNWMRIKKQQW